MRISSQCFLTKTEGDRTFQYNTPRSATNTDNMAMLAVRKELSSEGSAKKPITKSTSHTMVMKSTSLDQCNFFN